jgi:hypothetical protein
MRIDTSRKRGDTHIRVYNCPACHHEVWLTVWGADTVTNDLEEGLTNVGHAETTGRDRPA